jgi:hypothetical protein
MLARSSPAVRNHYNVVRPPIAISVRKGVQSAAALLVVRRSAPTRPTNRLYYGHNLEAKVLDQLVK